MTAGVSQGSVLGPTLWNVAYDDVLSLSLPKGASTVPYADGLGILVEAKSIEELEEITQDALDIVARWMKQN